MANQHAKCPRCRRRGTRWGGTRRRCASCGVTWRVRKKKRGRNPIRHTAESARRYVMDREAVRLRNAASYRRIMSREALVRCLPWPEIPRSGPVIVIADAFLQYIEHAWYTWYCILVRSVAGEDAIILKPLCRKGTEVALGWHEAFTALPRTLLDRVKVLVADGHTGLILEAKRRGWLIQRCHFHLIARLQQRRSRFFRGSHQKEGKRLYALVTNVVETQSLTLLACSLAELSRIGRTTTSADVRRVISGLLTHYEDYRTYLAHPELHLPTTSNTAEACVGLIRELCHRARGFRTVKSMNRWIEALIKVRKSIKCRGKTNRII